MVSLYVHAASHTVGQALRLLEDLLEHKVRIAALLDLAEVDVDGLHRQRLFLAVKTHHLQFLATTDHGDVAVLQVDHLVGIFHDGAGIRA